MTQRFIPGPVTIRVLGAGGVAALAAAVLGVSPDTVFQATIACAAVLVAACAYDIWMSSRAWRSSSPLLTRRLPAAFAIGVRRSVRLALAASGAQWHCRLYDHADPSVHTTGLPIALSIGANREVAVDYLARPTRRGDVRFAPADVRLRSRWGLVELLQRLGADESRRVYPDFAQVSRYAWLAGDRRLTEIGVKTYRRRGEGTDFKQLREYRVGDSVRHIDWRATQRLSRPIVREFQDERDQCVMFMLDCGRRMRADDREGAIGGTHFDQVLNAVLLLSYVALQEGDAVGALTFGTSTGDQRSVPPRKGLHALAGLMSELYDVQPTTSHTDYLAAAQDLMRRQRRRGLVIVITNFRDEDSPELRRALSVLRSRHRVLLASLRERVVSELMAQPLTSADAAIDVAGAHLYEQARRDAFDRLAGKDALAVDAEPARLGIELVNRYHAIQRAGLI
jgi:uncharacterized protein (DUF58 family)